MGKYWETAAYSQPDAKQLQQNAKATVKREREKGRKVEPVVIHGRQVASSWWGQAWCSNLEQYADYESRLDRGKRYVRTGAVVDLKIQKGKVQARVQGRRKTPYKIEIRISPLSEERCQNAIRQCERRIENLERLLNGEFPEELKELFTAEGGLFPAPNEISFNCSCPDWALMCKHVAAVLYGVGARFDENPLCFSNCGALMWANLLTWRLGTGLTVCWKMRTSRASASSDRSSGGTVRAVMQDGAGCFYGSEPVEVQAASMGVSLAVQATFMGGGRMRYRLLQWEWFRMEDQRGMG